MFYYENTKADRKLKRKTEEVNYCTRLFLVCGIVASCLAAKAETLPISKHSDVIKVQYKRVAMLKGFIKKKEGYSKAIYRDVAGFKTVGYGHKVTGKEGKLSHEAILNKDVLSVHNMLAEVVEVPLTHGQYVAIASLAYNVGNGAFTRSTLLKCLNAGNKACVNREFNKWVVAGGKVNKGLINRRNAEKLIYNEG